MGFKRHNEPLSVRDLELIGVNSGRVGYVLEIELDLVDTRIESLVTRVIHFDGPLRTNEIKHPLSRRVLLAMHMGIDMKVKLDCPRGSSEADCRNRRRDYIDSSHKRLIA